MLSHEIRIPKPITSTNYLANNHFRYLSKNFIIFVLFFFFFLIFTSRTLKCHVFKKARTEGRRKRETPIEQFRHNHQEIRLERSVFGSSLK